MSKAERLRTFEWCQKHNLQVVPLEEQSKAPTLSGWAKANINQEEVRTQIENTDCNIGIRLSGLADVDLDFSNNIPSKIAGFFLPKTKCIFGRKGRPNSHYLYSVTEEKINTSYEYGGQMIEIRSDTVQQTMAPGSVHPSGETVLWSYDRGALPKDIPKVSRDDLDHSVRLLMAASLLSTHWNEGGYRHFKAMALTGMLCRIAKFEDEDEDGPVKYFSQGDKLYEFVRAVCLGAGDEEADDRLRATITTLGKFNQGVPVIGGERLGKLMGEELVDRVRALLFSDDKYNKIEDFNKDWGLTIIGGKHAYIRKPKEFGEFASILNEGAFEKSTADRKIRIRREDETTIRLPIRNIWIDSPARSFYPNGLTFDPSEENVDDNQYNMFNGWPIQPAEGNCDTLLEHIKENIAQGNEEYAHYVLSWLADLFQNPTDRPGICLVLRGNKGSGKSILGEIITRLLGKYSATVSKADHLTGKFNAHLNAKLFVLVNEAFFAGNKQSEDTLKSLITDSEVMVEPKGFDAFPSPNLLRVMMTSNNDWVVPASSDERRYAVFDVGDRNRQDRKFFGKLLNELEKEKGYEAFLKYLLSYEYDKEELAILPKTEAFYDQLKLTNEQPVASWLARQTQDNILCTDCPDSALRKENKDDTWPIAVVRKYMWAQYEKDVLKAKGAKHNYTDTDERFYRELEKCLGNPKIILLKRKYFTKDLDGNEVERVRTQQAYVIPPREELHTRCEKILGYKISLPSLDLTLDTQKEMSDNGNSEISF